MKKTIIIFILSIFTYTNTLLSAQAQPITFPDVEPATCAIGNNVNVLMRPHDISQIDEIVNAASFCLGFSQDNCLKPTHEECSKMREKYKHDLIMKYFPDQINNINSEVVETPIIINNPINHDSSQDNNTSSESNTNTTPIPLIWKWHSDSKGWWFGNGNIYNKNRWFNVKSTWYWAEKNGYIWKHYGWYHGKKGWYYNRSSNGLITNKTQKLWSKIEKKYKYYTFDKNGYLK